MLLLLSEASNLIAQKFCGCVRAAGLFTVELAASYIATCSRTKMGGARNLDLIEAFSHAYKGK